MNNSFGDQLILFACCLGCWLAPLITQAQKDLDSIRIEVVGSYDPTIADAYKISDFPSIDETPPAKPEMHYHISSDKFISDFEVEPVKPATIKGEPLQKLYSGYVKIAGGAPGIFAADAYYNSLRSKKKSWGVHLNHFSSTGNVKDVGYSGFADNGLSLYGKKFLTKHTLSGGLDIDRDNLHYYGFDKKDSVIAMLDDSVTGKDATRQIYSTIGGYARLLSHYSDSNALNYDARFNYYNLTDNFQTMENGFNLSTDFTTYVDPEIFLLVRFNMDHTDDRFYREADSLRILTNTVLSLNPQFTTGGPRYQFTIGVNGTLDVIGDLNGFGTIYPCLYFSYNLVKDLMIPYVGIGGGLKRNNIRSLSRENPFIRTDLSDNRTSVNNTINSIKFYGGVKGEFSASSSFNVSVTRDKLDNQYFFVNDALLKPGNKFTLVYDNITLFNVHGEMSYHIRDKYKFMLSGDVNQYGMDKQEKAWHKPGYTISLLGAYNLKEKIIVKTDIFAIGDQYARAYDDTGSPVAVKMKGVLDLNLELEYRYTKKLSAYLKLNNLTAQRYDRWYGYPTMRFNFMGGLTYIF